MGNARLKYKVLYILIVTIAISAFKIIFSSMQLFK